MLTRAKVCNTHCLALYYAQLFFLRSYTYTLAHTCASGVIIKAERERERERKKRENEKELNLIGGKMLPLNACMYVSVVK